MQGWIPYLKKCLRSAITLINNETNVIIDIIRYLENRGILLNGTTGKFLSQGEELLNFLGLLMKVGLSLRKTVFTPLVKSVVMLLRLTAKGLGLDAAIQMKVLELEITTMIK